MGAQASPARKGRAKEHGTGCEGAAKLPPLILFGVNSSFALNHLLGHTLIRLAQKGYRLAAVAPDAERSFLHRAACPGILLRSIAIAREISLLSDLATLYRLTTLFRRWKPAIVNLSTPKMAFLGGLAAFLARVPRRIYFLRGLRYETTAGWKRGLLIVCEWAACACAHEVVCVSASVRQCAVEAGIVPRRKTVMLGAKASDGICLDGFEAGTDPASPPGKGLRRDLGVPDQSFVVGYVGRLTHDKGVEELVQATLKLAGDGRDVRLLMVGAFESGDPVDPECARLISTSALIHATGYVDDPKPYYPVMDLFALPSHREGLGNALLEAAAAGKPSVATRVTGIVDAVEDGVTGVLVPAHDILALANAIAALMDDPGRRQSMSKAGPVFVKKNFDADAMVDALSVFMTGPG